LNYWRLFGGVDEHNYYIDVLKAAMEWTECLYVNGQKFDFSEKAGSAARTLMQQWMALCDPLKRNAYRNRSMCTAGHVSKHELRDCLAQFDAAWVSFEEMYICELMKIEECSRAPILNAMKEEATLRALEEQAKSRGVAHGDLALLSNFEYLETCKRMISHLGRINAAGNRVGKGRDDLDATILVAIQRELDEDGNPRDNAGRAFAEAATKKGYDSWVQIREYLRIMSSKIEHVDPQYSNNTGLVKALVAWESDWAFIKRYLLDEAMCDEMCLIIQNMERALESLPRLQQSIDECDVELFMMVPRVVLVHFLLDPSSRQATIQSMLPDFIGSMECTQLCSQFATLGSSLLTELGIPDVASACGRARRTETLWQLFLEVWEQDATSVRAHSAAHKAVKEFLHILEPWSVMLQRSNPEDWNSFCHAIIHNLMEEDDDEQ